MAYESYIRHIFYGFCILLATEVVPKIFSNLNVVAHLVVLWAGDLSCHGWLFLKINESFIFIS